MARLGIKRLLALAAAVAAVLAVPCQLSRAAAAEDVLFEDSFDGDLSQWTIIGGDWLIKEGRLEGSGAGFPQLQTKQQFTGNLIIEFTAATVPPSNHDIQCVLFTNGYIFVLGANRNTGSMITRRGPPVAWTSRMTIEPGRTYAVKIIRRGGVLEFIVDGKLVLTWTDEHPFNSGPIALRTWASKIAIDNLRVRRFPEKRRIRVVNASTGRTLGADAVAALRAGGDSATWKATRVEGSSRLEPAFTFRTRSGTYRATFHAFPIENLDEYNDSDWFCLHFAGRPALRVHLQDVDSPRKRDYAKAAGLRVLSPQEGDSVFINVAGLALKRAAGRLDLFYGREGEQPKRIAARNVTLGTSSAPLLSHTLELKTETPGTYQVIARLTKGRTIVTSTTKTFHLMGDDELFDAGDGFRLRRAGFMVDIDKRTGTIKGLFEASGKWGTNYVANETNLADFAKGDTRFFGDVVVTSELSGLAERRESTALSYDVRRVAPYKGGVLVKYAEKSKVALGGFQNVRLWEFYRVNTATKTFDWDVYVENAQRFPIVIEEIALPLLVNDTLFDLGGNRELAHKQRVFAYPYAGGHSGFVLVQRLLGDPPYLLIVPADGTAFEASANAEHHGYRSRGAAWLGLHNLYLHSSAVAERAKWKPGLNPSTKITLKTGERRRFGLRMAWINSYDEIPATLFRLGKIGIQVAPGLVVPTNQTATLLCWSKKSILQVQPLDQGIKIVHTTSKGSATLYAIRFAGYGPKRLRLYTGPDEWTMVAFYAVPPIEKLIDARAGFIVNRQHYRDPDDTLGRDYGFMTWDTAVSSIAEQAWNPSALIGCSDLGGLADPFFLARKNVYRPNERQVRVLEEYVHNCLFKNVQDPETYKVRASLYVGQARAWPPPVGQDTTRTYNYAFVLNIYYDLYRIGSLYGLGKLKEPKEYLTMAANTAIAMFDHSRWRHEGHVGGGTVLDVLEALRREELADKHAELKTRIDACTKALEDKPFPYGSETLYDPTSYAHVYRLFRHLGANAKAEETLRVMLAVRGKQPVWYHYGADRHWWHFDTYGKRRALTEVGLFYTSAVNGAALLHGYRNLGERHMLLQGYAGVLSPWAAVNKVGEGSTGYHIDPRERAFDPLSAAGAIGLWGSLEGLGSYLVRDRDFGVIGLGCDVSTAGGYTIIPRDGLYKRAFFEPLGLGVELDVGRLTKVAAAANGTKVWVAFTVGKWFEKSTTLTVTGLRHGRYRVNANGKTQELSVEKAQLVLPPIETKGETNLVVIERVEEEPDEDEDDD